MARLLDFSLLNDRIYYMYLITWQIRLFVFKLDNLVTLGLTVLANKKQFHPNIAIYIENYKQINILFYSNVLVKILH